MRQSNENYLNGDNMPNSNAETHETGIILSKQSNENDIKRYFEAVLKLSNANEEFPVNIDEVWMLIYSAKEKAVRALISNKQFIEGVDYQVLAQNGENSNGGRPTIDYKLTVSCMEFFIARKVRSVFEVYRQVFHKVAQHPSSTLPDFTNPSEAARAWADQYDTAKTLMIENQGLKEEKQQLMKRNEALAKKATFADCVMQAENCITIAEMAQILHQNGLFNGGRGNLYKWMRLSGWLLSRGVRRNLPSQKAIKMGLMRVAEEPYQSNGSMAVNKYPVVTMKGQQYYLKIFGDDRMVDQRVLNFKN